ncbi:hypothetical protein FZZ91_00645 [Synechococcus sp. HB1133]|uniref:hypothetical protein n=1 Tax=unclassified Synechococcus TaxID=2626047 RepID=UPI00140A29F4|nr:MULTISPECIES: hypothetical protein [unclassified Synechococcus]MCB4393865.1 hypothetical protein [Synechococcus sp. PH41509]MCB4421345.1 hypothetical protein [Synechococcus sp. HB1133]MCB4431304.1 hypothetical protein [Synechococcus sp. HBA1120]NHI80287.1 hypothetical protein [Synechococcus sp. HB1133]
MKILEKLQNEEKNGNIEEYCKIADIILSQKESPFSPLTLRHIEERKNYYLKKQLCAYIKEGDIINSLNPWDFEALKKCCPNMDFGQERSKNPNEVKYTPLGSVLNNIYISKEKFLNISWLEDSTEVVETEYHIMQAMLSSEFKVIPLRRKYSRKLIGEKKEVIELENEFMPLFIISMNKDTKAVINLQCIAFPSTLPGGYHYSELADECGELSLMESIDRFKLKTINEVNKNKLQGIVMESDQYDVGIGFTHEDFRKWITVVHGIQIFHQCTSSNTNFVLSLPQKTYPTISLIINGLYITQFRDTNHSVGILIVHESDFEPLYKISASFPVDITAAKPDGIGIGPFFIDNIPTSNSSDGSSVPSICIFPDNTKTPLLSHINDHSYNKLIDNQSIANKNLYILVLIDQPQDLLEEFILAIAQQKVVNINQYIFYLRSSSDQSILDMRLQEIFESWELDFKYIMISSLNQINSHISDDSNLLVINQNIILQNNFTLAMLSLNLIRYNAFSSGCMLSHLKPNKNTELYDNQCVGLYPSFRNYSQSGRISLEARNLTSSLFPMEINVLSNHYDLCLFDSSSFNLNSLKHQYSSNLPLFLMQLSCYASIDGKQNVCSTKVSAQYACSPTLDMSHMLDLDTTNSIMQNLTKFSRSFSRIQKLLV